MDEVFSFLDKQGIEYKKFEHPPVFTTKEAHEYRPNAEFWENKNLFLRNRKGDKHYLVTLEAEKRLDLKKLGEALGEKVGFASPERLMKYLHIKPGSVSPFGLLNDSKHEVIFVLDRDALSFEKIGVHPNTNTQTILMKMQDFQKCIEILGNSFQILEL